MLGPMEGSAMAMGVDGVVSEGLRFGSVVSDAAGNFGGREIKRSQRCCGGVRFIGGAGDTFAQDDGG